MYVCYDSGGAWANLLATVRSSHQSLLPGLLTGPPWLLVDRRQAACACRQEAQGRNHAALQSAPSHPTRAPVLQLSLTLAPRISAPEAALLAAHATMNINFHGTLNPNAHSIPVLMAHGSSASCHAPPLLCTVRSLDGAAHK